MSVHHTRTGTTTRISVDSAGNKGNGDSYLPYISDDGRFVVFRSAADKLSEEDTNSMMDLFIRAEAFVPPFAAAGTRDSVIALPGTGPAVNRRSTAICADCVTLQ